MEYKKYTGEAPLVVDAPNIARDFEINCDKPYNGFVPIGTPVSVKGDIVEIIGIGTCYETVTGTTVKFHKDNTFKIGDQVEFGLEKTNITSIDISNEDYDVVVFSISETWTANSAYSSIFSANGIVSASTNVNEINSLPVVMGGVTRSIPTTWGDYVLDNILPAGVIK